MIEDSYVIAFGNGSSSSVFSDKFVCSVFVDYEFRNLPIMLFIQRKPESNTGMCVITVQHILIAT